MRHVISVNRGDYFAELTPFDLFNKIRRHPYLLCPDALECKYFLKGLRQLDLTILFFIILIIPFLVLLLLVGRYWGSTDGLRGLHLTWGQRLSAGGRLLVYTQVQVCKHADRLKTCY